MRADSLIEKELHSHSFIPSTFTVYPITPILIPETGSGQRPEKRNIVNVCLLCKNFENSV